MLPPAESIATITFARKLAAQNTLMILFIIDKTLYDRFNAPKWHQDIHSFHGRPERPHRIS